MKSICTLIFAILVSLFAGEKGKAQGVLISTGENTFAGDVVLSAGEGCPNGTEQTPSSDVGFERQIIVLLNNLRATNGLPRTAEVFRERNLFTVKQPSGNQWLTAR